MRHEIVKYLNLHELRVMRVVCKDYGEYYKEPTLAKIKYVNDLTIKWREQVPKMLKEFQKDIDYGMNVGWVYQAPALARMDMSLINLRAVKDFLMKEEGMARFGIESKIQGLPTPFNDKYSLGRYYALNEDIKIIKDGDATNTTTA
jgi:hypothetical protein